MSTINKTFLRVLLAIACCIALAFSLLPQAEAAMRADVVTGKVTLNGQVIDNKNAKYPLLSYSNITYFPMTYQLSRFMGVETDWNNAAKRKAEIVSLTQEMELCVPDPQREREMSGQELGMVLDSFLRTLTPENRVVFMRRYWYADSIAEIAARYGIGESAVQMRLNRTRAKLCTYLEKEGIRV